MTQSVPKSTKYGGDQMANPVLGGNGARLRKSITGTQIRMLEFASGCAQWKVLQQYHGVSHGDDMRSQWVPI